MTVSMEPGHPYRKMATTCKTRPVTAKRIVWPKPEPVVCDGGKFRVTLLRRDLVATAAKLWRLGYPELYGSPHEFLLDPDQYPRWLALEESWDQDAESKVYCMSVVEEVATGEVLSGSLLTKFENNRQVEFSFVATHPDHRLKRLTDQLRLFTRKIAMATGAEYFTTFCETWHAITQGWCVEGGWKIAGIFPGNFVRWNGANEEYRGCTVHFYRFVNGGDEYVTRPEEWQLAPKVKEVWEVLERVNQGI